MPRRIASGSPLRKALDDDAGRARTSTSGKMTKISGITDIDPTITLLRLYSRSSFRKIALTRLLLKVISDSPPCLHRRARGKHPRESGATHRLKARLLLPRRVPV